MINFDTILRECKAGYKPFTGTIVEDRVPKSFEKAILETFDRNPVITEIKPSSPSGRNRTVQDPMDLSNQMVRGGACGLSVLTEEKYFGGSLKNLQEVARASKVPVLRKDFIFHESQISESYYYGADSLLLIGSFFSGSQLKKFIDLSRNLGMEPLIEVHSFDDINKASHAGARLYVINNRDKDTLEIDLQRSEDLSIHIDELKIGASGIINKADLDYVLEFCDAVLIGNSIMRAQNVMEKTEEFVYGTR